LRGYRFRRSVLALVVLSSLWASASKKKTSPKLDDESWKSDPKFNSVVDKITAQEKLFINALRGYQPMVETYIQNMKPDKDLGSVPVSDEYFLGRIKMEQGVEDVDFLPDQKGSQTSLLHKIFSSMQNLPQLGGGKPQRGGYMSSGFAQMVVIDMSTFDRQHYDFRFVRREFLGDVRTLVIDVKPKEPQSKAMFIGRIWAEEEQYHVVRLNGKYQPNPKHGEYLHFDSWRENLTGDQWLPVYVFSEETDLTRGSDYWNYRAQTLLWGYSIGRPNKVSEYTDIVVDSPDKIKDQSDSKQDRTGVEGERAWQRQAEDNILDRMQRAALLAPEGDVDKVLNTVVQNIEVTNNLEVEPEIRCRVLLTEPLESFTVGHTIVVSRGLLDTLPDEASLAAVLAHEMGHILSSHQINEKYAFSDVLIFPDQTTIQNIRVNRSPEEEKEADAKAVQLLQNSPYKDKLSSAALFLAATQAQAGQLTHLLKGNFGYPLLTPENGLRMSALVPSAPTLQIRDVKQIAALPLGERIKLEPWSNQVTMQKTRSVNLVSANEKKPFEVTPRFPYLTRSPQVAAGASAQKIPSAAEAAPVPQR
jgi:Peptidase family M48